MRKIIIVLFMIGLAVVPWLLQRNAPQAQPIHTLQTETSSDPQQAATANPSPGRPPRTSKPDRIAQETERAWDISDTADGDRSFVIALNEAAVRETDGNVSFIALDPPATEETLRDRLDALTPDRAAPAWPVAYLAGEPRSDATRRILTPDLRMQIEGAPEDVARAAGLRVKDLPSYAPGWAILEAADPLAALDAMDELRASGHETADVLLAVQRETRAMPNDPLIAQQWHLNNIQSTRTHINVQSAWNYPNAGARGKGVRIGIVDDGLQTAHPDLATNVDTALGKDWNGNDSNPNPGTGDDHGTACAGNAAARGNNNLGVSGSAPEATLVGLRLIAAPTTDAQEAEALAWRNDVIQIKSNSWGPNDSGSNVEAPGPLTIAALANATTNGRGGLGTIFLWAGGNGGDISDNSNYDGYANSIHTIAVGASDSSGARASYSEPGANLVVVAPSSGVTDITTTDRTGSAGYASGDYTSDFGGTSSSTPTAAGVVALMLEKNPGLGWRDVQEILIRSAHRIRPSDADWSQNGAGISFNHQFGAGLVDATAAVNLADGWVNLQPVQSEVRSQSNTTAIPDNNATGISRSFNFSGANLRVEHVTVRLSITHSYRGDLEISLTSPSGMVSRLAEKRSDSNDNYSNWTFSTVRHWGENASGNWTLKIADRAGDDTGSLTAATVTLHGAPAAPSNPLPLVQITSPQNGAVFSPGSPIDVAITATDLAENGTAGDVVLVELLRNNAVVGSKTSAPYQFTLSPPTGDHTLVARATDSEGAVGNSASINITVRNQPPAITAASLSAGPQGFADEGLAVDDITASDPESTPLVFQYQWQSSSDGLGYSDTPGATADALAPSTDLAAKLWRCRITASDGENTSEPFITAATNLLNRPPATATIGEAFSHTSGLVLRGGGSTLARQAIINEFSQGPVGGNSEWIEILTLQDGSLAYWDIQDAGGDMIVFLDDPVWDDIPAGTVIVIYNGAATKDPLLPADDTDPSDGRMVVSSTNPAYFDDLFDAWPSLSNTNDAIFLNDAVSETVHELAYGSSTVATPNIGAVGSGKSAHFIGNDDTGADLAANWRTTSSLTARASRALLPGITLSGGGYSQNFNTAPGASGTNYPDGWTSYNVTTEDTMMTVGTSSSNTGANYNYGSRIGLLGSGSNFDPGSIVLAIQNTSGFSNVNLSYDVIKIREQGRSMDFILQYSLTSATSGFIDIPGGSYVSGSIAQNTVSSFSVPLPSALNDRSGPIYLRWLYATNSGSESRDGLALDNVVITTGSSTPSLGLSASPSSFVETAGPTASTGTVTIPAALPGNLSVALASSNPSFATVPATVVIPAGQTSATFPIGAVDDDLANGSRPVTISATATDYLAADLVVTVSDDEVALEGVTPGSGNTPANAAFITALRAGSHGTPALYRIGAGSTLPVGLALDAQTGTLSGVIDASNPPGDYLVVIERYNPQGEVVSTSFTLTLGSVGGGDFAAWIAEFSGQLDGLTGPGDDPDGDGIPNAVENLLGTSPTQASQGLVQTSAHANTLVFHHTLAENPASDLTAAYQWSADLTNWHESGEISAGTRISFVTAIVVDDAHPQGWRQVTATVLDGNPAKIFARLVTR